jgi:hypothetical protein
MLFTPKQIAAGNNSYNDDIDTEHDNYDSYPAIKLFLLYITFCWLGWFLFLVRYVALFFHRG